MSKIAIMTDSTCGLPPSIIERENLIVVPCQVQIGDQVYKEGVDLSAEELFNRLYSSNETPTTSLPAGEDYVAAFQKAKQRGADEILGIFVGSGLSGTFNGARLAAQEYSMTVELVDSGTTAIALGLLVLTAIQKIKNGVPLQQTAADLREIADRTELYALLDTLEYIRRGGRIGRVGELIANVLNIKPVLRVTRNSADVVARVRSHKKGVGWLVETTEAARPMHSAGVMHIRVPEEANELAVQVSKMLEGDPEILVEPITAAVAVHAGPGAIAVGFIRLEDPQG